MLTDKQRKIRKTGITGSEIAAVAGLSPYESPLTVWARKLDLIADEASAIMERGTYLEEGIRSWYCATTGANVAIAGTMVHPDNPLVIATPDGIAYHGDERRALEIKAPTWRTLKHWGDEGTDRIPEWYIPQCTWGAAVLGVELIDVAADMGDHLGLWTVKFDPELFRLLVEKASRFWADHVLTRTAPHPTGAEREVDVIRRLNPQSTTAKYLDADEPISSVVRRYRQAKDACKSADTELSAAENELRLIIGEHSGLRGQFGRIDYKNNKPTEKIDWQAIARELGASRELIQAHTEYKPGARPLRAYWGKQ